jgi:hypothetical protein
MGEDRIHERFAASPACHEFSAALAGFLDGDTGPAVVTHAQDCPFCHALLDDIELLRLASRDLPLEEPSPAVWAGIRALLAQEGILAEPTPAWRHWLRGLRFLPNPAPLAAVATIIICGVLLLVTDKARQLDLTRGASSVEIIAQAETPIDLGEEHALSRTLKEMEANYRVRLMSLDPEEKVVFQKSLESLDSSIDECRASAEKEPASDAAREYLVAAYTQKVEVLEAALEFQPR